MSEQCAMSEQSAMSKHSPMPERSLYNHEPQASRGLRSTPRAVTAALAALALIVGCVPSLEQNAPREPKLELPESFDTRSAGSPKPPKEGGVKIGQTSWRVFFTSPELQALIDTALNNNKELDIQLQEMLIAKYEIGAAKGEYLPKVSASAHVGLDKVGEHTSQGVSDEAHGVPNPLQDYGLGFSASWEVDVWKKLRNAAKAATYRYLASVEGRRWVVTKLVAEIAVAYYELLALDKQLEVLKNNIEIQRNALQVVQLQKLAARVTELAVQRFASEVLKNQSRQFTIEQKIAEAQNHINFLVGRYPQTIKRDGRQFEDVPEAAVVSVPAELLENRPDIRQAANELEATKLDVEVAKARFYPGLSIDAGVGYQAFNVKHLLATPDSLIGNLAGNLTAPLLNRQAIEADYYAANARQLKAVYNYERAVLGAFTEVANQLSMVENLRRTAELQAQQVEMLTQSIAVSNTLFQSARADYMEVLLTRRDALDAQMELIETKLQQRQALVNVYQALGGGWRGGAKE